MITLERTMAPPSLRECLVAGARQARLTGAPVLVSYGEPLPAADPFAFFARGRFVAPTRVYWANPRQLLVLVGVGATHEVTGAGPARFATMAAACQTVMQHVTRGPAPERSAGPQHATRNTPQGPVWLGGFAFDPQGPTTETWEGFPAGLLILPRFLLAATPDGATLTTCVVVDPDTDPDAAAARLAGERELLLAGDEPATHHATRTTHHATRTKDVRPAADWKAAVAAVAADIRAGAIEKVVLARAVQVDADRVLNPAAILARLQAGYPDCYIFAVARGTRCFLGATPERLVGLQDGVVQATCLAGSARRSADADEDARLGAALLASAKDREEHAVVVRTLADALRAVCTRVEMPPAPALLRLRNVQHLYTPLSGHLRNGTGLLDLVAGIHPTPAVGGFPRDAALARIQACEGLDRGWYAGPVGWVDSQGEGEFAVAIRSALVHDSTARAFAGCGIMADSRPDDEYVETQVKLRAILSALDEAGT